MADSAIATARLRVAPAVRVDGHIGVPGDKSISHRALLIGALTGGETLVRQFGRSGDTESTLGVVRALGVEVEERDVDTLVVHGVGVRGLKAPAGPLDCGNAGTLARLVTGILAFQEGRFELVGDESLSRRPMSRVVRPLARMGAEIEAADGHLPLIVEGRALHGIEFQPEVSSAQVKSAILLAGLGASGRTTVIEPSPSRDHTELMLAAAGATVTRTAASVTISAPERLSLPEVLVPGDISSAAPFLVAAALVPGSTLTVHDLGLNPLRAGLLEVLARMGARIGVHNKRRVAGELVGDVEIAAQPLVATRITAAEVPSMIDELPLIALLGAFAHGTTKVTGAGELREKESDRIETVTAALRAIGVGGTRIRTYPDGFSIRGVPTRPRGGMVDAAGDHRIAMLGAIAGSVSREGVEIVGPECAAISFPGFYDLLESVIQR